MNIFYKISIDLVNANYISGWCFHRFRKHSGVQLAVYCDRECLGEMDADQVREDLEALAVHPTGKCGFKLVLSRTIRPQDGILRLVERSAGTILAEVYCADFSVKRKISLNRLLDLSRKIVTRKKDTILFMHIPKTAGTSFNTIARKLLPAEQCISHIEAVNEGEFGYIRAQYRYISGHLRYGIFKEKFCDSDTELFTIVREPYSHLHSHLKWLIRKMSDPDVETLRSQNRVIFELGLRIKGIDFGNIDEIRSFPVEIDTVQAAFFDNMQTRHFLDTQVDHVQKSDLQEAIKHTREFKHIGITEKYDRFVREFARLNGLEGETEIVPLNRSSSGQLFDIDDEKVREALFPLVRYDLLLYEHICKTF